MVDWKEILEAAAEGYLQHKTRQDLRNAVTQYGRPPGQCVALYMSYASVVAMPGLEYESMKRSMFGETGTVRMERDEQQLQFILLWSPDE